MTNPNSRPSARAAIDAKCFDCTYCPDELGGKLQQTAICTVRSCPLFPVRPTPRDCKSEGLIDEAKCDTLRAALLSPYDWASWQRKNGLS